jgi:hypothetical protein
MQFLLRTVSLLFTVSLLVIPVSGHEPKRLVLGPVIYSYTVAPDGFLGAQTVTEANGLLVACYGTLTVENKTRYTYLILFKTDPLKHKGGGVGVGDLPDKGDKGRKGFFGANPVEADLPLWVAAGETKFEFTYKIKTDKKRAVVSESIQIGGKEHDKDLPRFFLVDLTQKKPTCVAVKSAELPLVTGGDERAKAIAQTIRQLKEKTEVKEFFAEKAK